MKSSKLSPKKIALLVLAVIVVIALVCVGDWVHRYEFPLSNPTYGFQFLRPTKLPPGFHVTASRIDVATEDGKILGISAEMNLRNVDWVYEIQESKYGAYSGEDNIRTSLRNFSPMSVKPTCTQKTTSAGTLYRLCHWIDYGRISVYEVRFRHGGTFVETRFPAGLRQTVTIPELSAFVDSFTPAAPPHNIVSGI